MWPPRHAPNAQNTQNAQNTNEANGDKAVHFIEDVAVIGAGHSNLGIVESCLLAGFSTLMVRVTPGSAAEPRRRIIDAIVKKERDGRLGKEAVERALDRLRATTDIAAVASSDLVLESTESPLRARRTILQLAEQATEAHAEGHAILASTAPTSMLRMLAAGLFVPERFLGMHLFSPAVLASFCEVSVTHCTAPTVLEATVEFVERLGKRPVIVHDLPALLLFFSQRAAAAERRA